VCAEIDRAGHLAAAFFAAQAGKDLRKGKIAAPLGKQAHGIDSFSLAACSNEAPRSSRANQASDESTGIEADASAYFS
jgi:hypothetical protein